MLSPPLETLELAERVTSSTTEDVWPAIDDLVDVINAASPPATAPELRVVIVNALGRRIPAANASDASKRRYVAALNATLFAPHQLLPDAVASATSQLAEFIGRLDIHDFRADTSPGQTTRAARIVNPILASVASLLETMRPPLSSRESVAGGSGTGGGGGVGAGDETDRMLRLELRAAVSGVCRLLSTSQTPDDPPVAFSSFVPGAVLPRAAALHRSISMGCHRASAGSSLELPAAPIDGIAARVVFDASVVANAATMGSARTGSTAVRSGSTGRRLLAAQLDAFLIDWPYPPAGMPPPTTESEEPVHLASRGVSVEISTQGIAGDVTPGDVAAAAAPILAGRVDGGGRTTIWLARTGHAQYPCSTDSECDDTTSFLNSSGNEPPRRGACVAGACACVLPWTGRGCSKQLACSWWAPQAGWEIPEATLPIPNGSSAALAMLNGSSAALARNGAACELDVDRASAGFEPETPVRVADTLELP